VIAASPVRAGMSKDCVRKESRFAAAEMTIDCQDAVTPPDDRSSNRPPGSPLRLGLALLSGDPPPAVDPSRLPIRGGFAAPICMCNRSRKTRVAKASNDLRLQTSESVAANLN